MPPPTGTPDNAPGEPTNFEVAVVLNTRRLHHPAATQARLLHLLEVAGVPNARWMPVGPETGAQGAARDAVRQGARLVLAGGGDGTVRAVAAGIRGSGAALGILPLGTANVLARNLGIPLDLPSAVRLAVSSRRRRVDLGETGEGIFTVAVGIGFDAQMLAGAVAAARRHLGVPAYVLSGLRHLGDPSFEVELWMDGAPPLRRRVAAVLVSNVPRLPLGITLDPEGRLDDGRLEVVAIQPRGLAGWPKVAAGLLGRRRGRSVERFHVSRVRIRASGSHPREMDGDPIPAGAELSAWVLPGELEVAAPG